MGHKCCFQIIRTEMDNYGILQHMGFYPPTENQCVMMREDLKTQSSEYIYIA